MRSLDYESEATVSIEDSTYSEDDRLLGSVGELDEVLTSAGWSQATPRILDATEETWELKKSQMTPMEDRVQTALWLIISLLNIGIMALSLYLFVAEPKAMRDLVFHGIVGPSQLIQIVVGFTSTVYGALALYNHKASYDSSRKLFRRYLRNNKLFLLNWVISTATCVYGCWKFTLLYTMDVEHDTLKKFWDFVDGKYSLFMIDVLVGVTDLFWLLRDNDVTFKENPFPFIFNIGNNPWLAGVFMVLVPALVLGAALWFQHGYYRKKYFQVVKRN